MAMFSGERYDWLHEFREDVNHIFQAQKAVNPVLKLSFPAETE
jgi:hypothetical protein